jgi:plastocyanin
MNRRRMARLVKGGVAACLTAALAGCGGGSSSSSSSGGTCSAGTAGVNVGSATSTVKATDSLTFTPQTVTVGVGQVLQWSNTGSVGHTVTFDDSANGCLSDVSLQGGSTWQVKFAQAGTYAYHCTIHPQMTGTITVS